jgi:hypothetical protein
MLHLVDFLLYHRPFVLASVFHISNILTSGSHRERTCLAVTQLHAYDVNYNLHGDD